MTAAPRIARDLVVWEGGTDLVLSVIAQATAAEVWAALADPHRCAEFFAPYELVDDADGDLIAAFASDDGGFEAVVVSAEIPAGALAAGGRAERHEGADGGHIVLDVDGLGRIGIALAEDAGATEISLAHTLAAAGEASDDAELDAAAGEAAAAWEHHLVLLLDHLAGGAADGASEPAADESAPADSEPADPAEGDRP